MGVSNTQVNPARQVETPKLGVSTNEPNPARQVETPKLGVSTVGNNPQWKSGTLGVMVNQYKRKCTITIREKYNKNFFWQSGYYDRVIRNDTELHNIQNYIINNPAKWHFDRNNPANFK